ncbi:penicillin-binding protein activator [Hydrogenivirga sp. 128-5-R1-1]|uniref:ABC transporter substrate-binding protein n=1 Tax=Hydrogenivirga sp. 128-5-R1-1 TaxID=392423 RepID=UPI00015F3355|nr:penicillin-binding protein activator [Hydrogenivirga sp. 128-5-R1-1]EDP74872.1 ABC transporter substrate-binding protein [Hydrogenivirga sp. 128-5-R1-1]
MRKERLLTVLLFIFLFLISCEKQSEQTLKIGVLTPLTGPGALWGKNTLKGAELAVEELRKQGANIKLVVEDSKGSPLEGVKALQKMITLDRIDFLIDDAVSSVALAIVNILTQKKLVCLSTGSTNPKLSGASPYFFRLWNSDAEEASVIAKYALRRGFRAAYVIYIRNDYGEGLARKFREVFVKNGGEILLENSFAPGTSNFQYFISKIKNVHKANKSFIYIIGYPREIPSLIVQIRKSNVQIPIFGTAAFEDSSILARAGKYMEGVIYPYPKVVVTAKREHFEKVYEKKYGEKPGSPAAEAYDAVYILYKAYKKVGTDADKVREFLLNLRYEGASGYIDFDEFGDVHKPFVIKTVRNGEFLIMEDNL